MLFATQVYPKTKYGCQYRSFSSAFFKEFEWLEYSVIKDAVYCFPCRIFSNDYGYTENTFTEIGFSNWRKVSFTKLITY